MNSSSHIEAFERSDIVAAANALYDAVEARDVDTAVTLAQNRRTLRNLIYALIASHSSDDLEWILTHIRTSRSLFLEEATVAYVSEYVRYALDNFRYSSDQLARTLALLNASAGSDAYAAMAATDSNLSAKYSRIYDSLVAAARR